MRFAQELTQVNDFGFGTADATQTILLNIVNTPPPAATKVTALQLINTADNSVIKMLKMYDTLSLATLPPTLGFRGLAEHHRVPRGPATKSAT